MLTPLSSWSLISFIFLYLTEDVCQRGPEEKSASLKVYEKKSHTFSVLGHKLEINKSFH